MKTRFYKYKISIGVRVGGQVAARIGYLKSRIGYLNSCVDLHLSISLAYISKASVTENFWCNFRN